MHILRIGRRKLDLNDDFRKKKPEWICQYWFLPFCWKDCCSFLIGVRSNLTFTTSWRHRSSSFGFKRAKKHIYPVIDYLVENQTIIVLNQRDYILSNLLCKDGNAQFTMIPLKALKVSRVPLWLGNCDLRMEGHLKLRWQSLYKEFWLKTRCRSVQFSLT